MLTTCVGLGTCFSPPLGAAGLLLGHVYPYRPCMLLVPVPAGGCACCVPMLPSPVPRGAAPAEERYQVWSLQPAHITSPSRLQPHLVIASPPLPPSSLRPPPGDYDRAEGDPRVPAHVRTCHACIMNRHGDGQQPGAYPHTELNKGGPAGLAQRTQPPPGTASHHGC